MRDHCTAAPTCLILVYIGGRRTGRTIRTARRPPEPPAPPKGVPHGRHRRHTDRARPAGLRVPARSGGDRGPPARPAADPGREGPRQPPGDPEGQEMERGRSYADFHPDRVAMQDATAQMALLQFMTAGLPEVAVPSTVHCDHLILAKAGADIDLHFALDVNREVYEFLRTVSEQVRHRLLEAGQRHHPPGRAGELRLPGRDDDRHRQPHPERRRARHGRHRRGRRRRRRRDDRLPVQRPLAQGHRRAPHRLAVGLVVAEGRHPRGGPRCSPSPEGTGAIVEYFGPGADTISATGKATICNMGAEIGATCSLFAYDQNMADVPEGHRAGGHRRRRRPRGRAPPARRRRAQYDQLIEIDLDQLQAPHQRPPLPRPGPPRRHRRRRGGRGERLAARPSRPR